jgi:hypothetical protein
MTFRGLGWLGLLAASSLPVLSTLPTLGCGARALDPGMNPSMTGAAGQGGPSDLPPVPHPPPDLVGALKAVAGSDRLLIVGTNAGAVTVISTRGPYTPFIEDPERLDEAAAMVGLPVCSVEFETLSFDASAADGAVTVGDALDACLKEDLQDMLDRLGGLWTPETVVVVAANTAITDHTTNGGINYFYDADIGRLLHAARKLYVPVCNIRSASLSLPSPEGQTDGVSIERALASCGRT